ncbi:hypothetical protein M0R88_12485 [Halorussus gelatinilyticus]|uniref:Uncharacterized protein n=1 Tax=Halorussus gelatinilyticus TaxID=2937524 RepID=A0A8U0IGZ7_9EURY|nr:hypothetical protein [Halorussus gelatinilyticus]UPV99338.1 hypothetical protein M0R88_12485 [Halorussus gelatinilyticus]
MKSIRRGLWDGEVGKDARGRFSCRICRVSLTPSEAPTGDSAASGESPDAAESPAMDGPGVADSAATDEPVDGEETIRSCPECGRSWRTTAPRWRTTGG